MFGTKLQKIRTEKNFSQSEMATLLEVSQSTYCDWESNINKPNASNLIKLCKVLEIDIYDLMDSDKKIINKNKECHNSFYGFAENNHMNSTSQNIIELLQNILATQNEILKHISKK